MKIRDLIIGTDIKAFQDKTDVLDIEISEISNDSRTTKKGCLFAARKGVNVDSNAYIGQAIAAGSSAVLTDDLESAKKFSSENVAVIYTADALKGYALVSKNFFGNPGKNLKIVGVTGTNGKTTTTFLVKSMLAAGGVKGGLVGTIDYETGRNTTGSKNTTPDAFELNGMFKEMVDSGMGACVMEASSHSLVQDRVYGVPFDAAVFTNLTRDHLDYHNDMEEYFKAKKKLFSELLQQSSKETKYAAVNIDDPYGRRLASELKKEYSVHSGENLLTYAAGPEKKPDLWAENVSCRRDGISLDIIMPGGKAIKGINSPLIGSYNVYNMLSAAAAAFALSVPLDAVKRGIENLLGVPGRVERVLPGTGKYPLVCIDYAHTDDALMRVLSALKELASGRLISVFGCGGDRDKGKRPLMGRNSTEVADISIITSDNPRSEEPMDIIKEIETGIKRASFVERTDLNALSAPVKKMPGHVYTVEEDRARAIRLALSVARSDDAVLIAGKGHEDYMLVKGKKFHFSDREEVVKYYENSL